MKVITIAFKNLARKKIRTALTVGGIGLAVAVLVSLMGFDAGYQKALNSDIDKLGYHLLVTAKGCPYEAATLILKGGGGLRYMDELIFKKIANDPRVEKVTPQLMNTVYNQEANSGKGGFAMYIGIDQSYMELKPWLKYKWGGWFSSDMADEVVMGYEAAELEQRKVGDKVFIPGINKVLVVKGVLERSGTQDDGILFLPLKLAQSLFSLPSQLTGVGIKLKNIQDIMKFEDDMYREPEIQVISLTQVKGTILNLVGSARAMATSVALIAIFVAIIGVTNTILMSVFERTREIGVMKALGASAFDVFKIIWSETAALCFTGGLFGIILAVLGSGLAEKLIRLSLPYAPSGSLVLIEPQFVGIALLATLLMGLLAGTYPAWRAARLKPVEAIRQGE